MNQAAFKRMMDIFAASQVVWERMQAAGSTSPHWPRLRRKHTLLATRYRMAREMAEPRTLN